MDGNSIAILQDYQSSIDYSFKKMDKSLKEFPQSDQSQQNLILNSLKSDLSSIKTNVGLMKMELSNLKEPGNVTKWQETISELQTKYDSSKEEINKMKNQKHHPLEDDPMNIDIKVDMSKMSSQQVMDRGDKILNADREAINRMKKVVNQDLETMKDVNRELLSQNEKLENADKDLKEIDNSLNRAATQIKSMAKMYAKDKIIMCMIVFILLVIIAIVVVSFFKSKGGDENSQNDSFKNEDQNNNASFFNKYSLFGYLLFMLSSYLF